jgi:hypothetical protein
MAIFPPYLPYDVPPRRNHGDLASLGAAGAALAVICAGMFAYSAYSTSAARQSLTSAVNATPLPDGDYLIRTEASFHEAGECWFRGELQGPSAKAGKQTTSDVLVYGRGLLQCGGPTESYADVHITVSDGTAAITGLSGFEAV